MSFSRAFRLSCSCLATRSKRSSAFAASAPKSNCVRSSLMRSRLLSKVRRTAASVSRKLNFEKLSSRVSFRNSDLPYHARCRARSVGAVVANPVCSVKFERARTAETLLPVGTGPPRRVLPQKRYSMASNSDVLPTPFTPRIRLTEPNENCFLTGYFRKWLMVRLERKSFAMARSASPS